MQIYIKNASDLNLYGGLTPGASNFLKPNKRKPEFSHIIREILSDHGKMMSEYLNVPVSLITLRFIDIEIFFDPNLN